MCDQGQGWFGITVQDPVDVVVANDITLLNPDRQQFLAIKLLGFGITVLDPVVDVVANNSDSARSR